MLVNEHTTGTGEIVTAFAAENRLATVVGERTVGRVLQNHLFRVGHGYSVSFPTIDYRTSQGARLEGNGVEPDIEVPFDPEAMRNGVDAQLNAAVSALYSGAVQRAAAG